MKQHVTRVWCATVLLGFVGCHDASSASHDADASDPATGGDASDAPRVGDASNGGDAGSRGDAGSGVDVPAGDDGGVSPGSDADGPEASGGTDGGGDFDVVAPDDTGAPGGTDAGTPPDNDAGVAGGPNPITLENMLPGTDAWHLDQPADNREVEGYASTTSAAAGESFNLYVHTSSPHQVRWQAYRLGYYQGLGGRLVASGGPVAVSPQPDCPEESVTGMIECHWSPTFSITPDATWVTGEYLIKLVRDDGYDYYVPMIIRESGRRAPLVFSAAVNTWQAYNKWGGMSLYVNNGPNPAFTPSHGYRVSFDRPYDADDHGSGQMRWWEAYMVYFLEKRGYDVSYVTDVDIDADATLILNRKFYMIVGHDEYWTMAERDAADHARDVGVSIGFFSADTATFHVRYADSTAGVPRRTIICYKVDGGDDDPYRGTPMQTTRFQEPAINRPENALIGVMYTAYTGGPRVPLVVSNPSHWIFAGTGVARGDALAAVVGSEFDRVYDSPPSPPGLEVITDSPGFSGDGTPDHSNATVYYPTPNSIVFAAGTLSWARGLTPNDVEDPRLERMTENILARAGLPVATPTVP